MSNDHDKEHKPLTPRLMLAVFVVPIWMIVVVAVLLNLYVFYEHYYRPLHQTRVTLRKHFPEWLELVPSDQLEPYQRLHSIAMSDEHNLETYDTIGVRLLSQIADGRIDEAEVEGAIALCLAIAQYENLYSYRGQMAREPGIAEARAKFEDLGAVALDW